MTKNIIAVFLLLAACSDPGPIKDTKPVTFQVPDLGVVTRFSVHDGHGGTHYIYRVDGRNEINITIPKKGKGSHQKTIVIDGEEFELVPKAK